MSKRPRRYPHPASAATTRTMRANRRVDTRPEILVRSLLHRSGLRFRKDLAVRHAAGSSRPDIAFPRLRIAIFVDGCFWHACPRHGTTPTRNSWYWTPKLQRNKARDVTGTAELRRAGWIVRRFWEHTPADRIAQQVAALVGRLTD